MAGLLSDPHRMNLILNGIGLLGAKFQDQSDRHLQGIQQGLLQQSRLNQNSAEKKADRKFNQPLQDARTNLINAQIGSAQSPERKTEKDANGRLRYVDDGSFVFDVTQNQTPFAGKGLMSSVGNIISTLGAKQQRGEPLTQEEQNALTFATNVAGREQFIQSDSGTVRIPGIDISFLGGQPTSQPVVNTQPVSSPEVVIPKTPAGVKKVDEAFAQEYLEWTRGGFSDAQKSITALNKAANDLRSGKTSTGGAAAVVDSVLPDSAVGFLAPDFKNTKDLVEEQVQRNLRLILGAQFTEKEGARLISRAFNPSLPTEQNVERLQLLIEQISSAAEAKQAQAQYFEKNGTLQGFEGKVFTIDDFDPDKLFTESQKFSQEDLEFTAKKRGLTVEQVKEQLRKAGKL